MFFEKKSQKKILAVPCSLLQTKTRWLYQQGVILKPEVVTPFLCYVLGRTTRQAFFFFKPSTRGYYSCGGQWRYFHSTLLSKREQNVLRATGRRYHDHFFVLPTQNRTLSHFSFEMKFYRKTYAIVLRDCFRTAGIFLKCEFFNLNLFLRVFRFFLLIIVSGYYKA